MSSAARRRARRERDPFFELGATTRRRYLLHGAGDDENLGREMSYEHDWDTILDGGDRDRDVLRRDLLAQVIADVMGELNDTQALCLYVYVLDGQHTVHGQLRKDTAWAQAARAVGVNPATGKPMHGKTMKRNVLSALAVLERHLLALPVWQQVLLEVPGAGTGRLVPVTLGWLDKVLAPAA